MDLPDSAVGTVRHRGWARTSRGHGSSAAKHQGLTAVAALAPSLVVILVLACAARPGRRDLTGPQGREAGRAGRHRVAVRPSNGKGTMSGRYDARRSRLER